MRGGDGNGNGNIIIMMVLIKIIGGVACLLLGIWWFIDTKKYINAPDNDPNPEMDYYYYKKMRSNQSYGAAIMFILFGLGLIISCFHHAFVPLALGIFLLIAGIYVFCSYKNDLKKEHELTKDDLLSKSIKTYMVTIALITLGIAIIRYSFY